MLSMSSLPRKPRRVVEVDDVAVPMSMATLPAKKDRARSITATIATPEPPTKILSMSDLRPRKAAERHRADRAQVEARRFPNRGPVTPYLTKPAQFGPKIFSNYVPDGIWKGHRAFIVGGGPSLRRMRLEDLGGELVIGINRACEACDPSILYGVDGQLFGWAELGQLGDRARDAFRGYKGYKAWMALHKVYPEDFYLINIDSSPRYDIGTTKRLAFKNNSGYGAINLAAALGANPIYLLGFDMAGNKQGKQRWWHSGYPVDYGERIYKKYIEAITKFSVTLGNAGIQVINLNPKSRLKCFPFGDFREVMQHKVNRPMVVSFYTKGTGYEKEAMRLMQELHLFGLEHDIQGINSFGSWQKNTQYKAKFIDEMMAKYPRRHILWLDVDSSIYQYPEVFDNPTFDLGVHEIDWAKYSGGRRRDHQLANAVIYLKNNDRVRQFVREWVCENEAHPGDIEMQTMARVLERWKSKLDFFNLPPSYCQIFDLMAEEGHPVIEQRQASRRYRNQVGNNDPVAVVEKKKYDDCWTSNYKKSACAEPLVAHVLKTMKPGDKVLDIGCGDGTTVNWLRAAGVDATGVDISLKGVPKDMYGVLEAPVWDMPFDDRQFDYTVSTDVLEHVPTEMLEKALAEIFRVTKRQSFHVVALFDGIRNGVVLHMTVKPIEWWTKLFAKVPHPGLNVEVMSRPVFMGGPNK